MSVKKTHMELKIAMQTLAQTNKNNSYQYLEDIFKIIISSVDKFEKMKDVSDWSSQQEKIKDIFYDSLSDTYATTSKVVGELYEEVPKFNIRDIFKMTYRKDGKTLEQRISSYWEEGLNQLEDGEDPDQVKRYLEYRFEILLLNETAIVETAVKKNKKPIRATILVIESGCTCGDGYCDQQAGEYPADEDVDLPPYHPGCDCEWWYEETDDIDDIVDLDLEVEE